MRCIVEQAEALIGPPARHRSGRRACRACRRASRRRRRPSDRADPAHAHARPAPVAGHPGCGTARRPAAGPAARGHPAAKLGHAHRQHHARAAARTVGARFPEPRLRIARPAQAGPTWVQSERPSHLDRPEVRPCPANSTRSPVLSSLNKAPVSAFIIARLPPGATPAALLRSTRHHATGIWAYYRVQDEHAVNAHTFFTRPP